MTRTQRRILESLKSHGEWIVSCDIDCQNRTIMALVESGHVELNSVAGLNEYRATPIISTRPPNNKGH